MPRPRRKPKLKPRPRHNVADLKDEDVGVDRTQAEELLEVADHVVVVEEEEVEGSQVDGVSLLTAVLVILLVLAVEVVGSPLHRIRILGSTLCRIFARKISFRAAFSSFPRNDVRKMRTLSPTKTSAMRQKRA
jgi:hypothetical protein